MGTSSFISGYIGPNGRAPLWRISSWQLLLFLSPDHSSTKYLNTTISTTQKQLIYAKLVLRTHPLCHSCWLQSHLGWKQHRHFPIELSINWGTVYKPLSNTPRINHIGPIVGKTCPSDPIHIPIKPLQSLVKSPCLMFESASHHFWIFLAFD